jgi:putative ABC transport system ATP-binding protein
MQRNLFTYIWRHSRPEQIVILGLVALAQVFYFMSLTVPKSVINNGIQGNAFKDSKTIPFLVWELDLSATTASCASRRPTSARSSRPSLPP